MKEVLKILSTTILSMDLDDKLLTKEERECLESFVSEQ